jgi:hypothetical protein
MRQPTFSLTRETLNSVMTQRAHTRAGEERTALLLLLLIAAATVAAHLATGGQYGFNRDELQTLSDARRLAWGYVAYPPATPFFGRISLLLFGASLRGFRLFAALAEAVAVVLTGLMARELGGRRWAQLIAAMAAVPFCIGGGALMQYVSFDYLCWVLTAWFTLLLLKSANPRWWIAIGAAVGCGMLAKYAMPFFVAGLAAGLAIESLRSRGADASGGAENETRRLLLNRWMWAGAGVALAIMAPNLVWQARHGFIYLDFIRHIHARDVGEGRARGFLPGQIKITLLALPVWVCGLWFYLRAPEGRRYRTLGWMYVVPLALFVVAQGREYYLAAAYPMLYAAGAVWIERRLAHARLSWRRIISAALWTALSADAALAAALTLPIAPVGSRWFKIASSQNGDLREEIGWPELVGTIAGIRDSLTAGQRSGLGILAANYGEAGAVELYGRNYALPEPISGVNSFWLRGYGSPAPQTLIVVGLPRGYVEKTFAHCAVAGHTWNRYGVANEETSEHPDIFVCGPPRQGWPGFWKNFRYFG